MKKMMSMLMATVMLLTMFCSLAVSPVSAEKDWDDSIARIIDLLPSEALPLDEAGCRVTRNGDGSLRADVTKAWSGNVDDPAYGMMFMPLLEKVNLTDMYLHIGITTNTPIRIVTMDMPDWDIEKMFGFELVAEFEIAPVGQPSINVDADGNFYYPENGFMPAGTYEICVPYGELYQFYEDYDFPYIDTDKANITAIYIDAKNKGSFTVNTLKLSTESVFSTYTKNSRYPDVKKGQWYYDAVEYVSENGFMTGYKNGTFGPANTLQRQDFVVTLARIAGVDLTAYQTAALTFEDVKMGEYYGPAVAWAVENGIVTGYNERKFGVGDTVNREQVATILYRFLGSPAVENADETLAAYPDASHISPFAKDAMAWAVQNGVISGLKSGKIAPKSGASRAQIATILMRMDQGGLL